MSMHRVVEVGINVPIGEYQGFKKEAIAQGISFKPVKGDTRMVFRLNSPTVEQRNNLPAKFVERVEAGMNAFWVPDWLLAEAEKSMILLLAEGFFFDNDGNHTVLYVREKDGGRQKAIYPSGKKFPDGFQCQYCFHSKAVEIESYSKEGKPFVRLAKLSLRFEYSKSGERGAGGFIFVEYDELYDGPQQELPPTLRWFYQGVLAAQAKRIGGTPWEVYGAIDRPANFVDMICPFCGRRIYRGASEESGQFQIIPHLNINGGICPWSFTNWTGEGGYRIPTIGLEVAKIGKGKIWFFILRQHKDVDSEEEPYEKVDEAEEEATCLVVTDQEVANERLEVQAEAADLKAAVAHPNQNPGPAATRPSEVKEALALLASAVPEAEVTLDQVDADATNKGMDAAEPIDDSTQLTPDRMSLFLRIEPGLAAAIANRLGGFAPAPATTSVSASEVLKAGMEAAEDTAAVKFLAKPIMEMEEMK